MIADPIHRFTRVEFTRFKAFEKFSIELRHFNVLVGPNNSGKSTILAAFRILAAAMRRANARRAAVLGGSLGYGYDVDLSSISIAEKTYSSTMKKRKRRKLCFTSQIRAN